ncbi:MAG: hypothetical protein HOI23_19250 [Deltaproteobacteria bacterium]|jgi:hypothetical protein|nr:hypothetical protein [Deltaproteobacteria bacterium]MBT6433992.1 hypothetical protein [Deltaproteobacteria bacterium]MBT6492566.1 hypothetical protein [Deltaproteobacteria bacterium]
MASRLNLNRPFHNWKFTVLIASTALMALTPSVFARPTNNSDLFSFSITDQVTHWETPDGVIRVHYSSEGPNQTRMQDTNDDGVPDFVEKVAEIAQESLTIFNSLNFYRPLREYDFAVADDGGSDAIDFYLVDFAGNADGNFSIDTCDNDNRCTGYMVIENDFAGYNYSSYLEGLRTVIPHELFHFIQAAYNSQLPIWVSEGTAVWGQRRYDPDSRDFRGFANYYLSDTDRPLNKPPAGPVPAFAYGTGIWWEFLSLRHDTNLINELLLAWEGLTADADFVIAMVEQLENRNDTMEAAWLDFSSYNLGTGTRAGPLESYPDAALFAGIQPAQQSSLNTVETSNRFYPMTTSYYLVEHTGGPLYWAMAKESANLRLSYFQAISAVGEVQLSLDQWASDMTQPYALQNGEPLPAGSYWLAVMNPTTSGNSVYTDICLGPLSVAESCIAEDETQDPGASGEPSGEDEDNSSGCQQATHPSLWLLLIGLFFWNRTSRKSRTQQTH